MNNNAYLRSSKKAPASSSRFHKAILILLVTNLAITIIRLIFIRPSSKQATSAEKVGATEEEIKNQTVFEISLKDETPPLTQGPRRIHYQFSVVLPQTALTLVSVLQGVAFGILLVNTPLLSSLTAFSWNLLIQQYLYLPYIISVIVILLIWQEYASAIIFILWPQSMYQYFLIFLMALAEILTFRQIDSLSLWLVGIGCIAFIGGGTRLSNLRLITKDIYDPLPSLEEVIRSDKQLEIRDGLLYISLGIVLLFCGLGYHPLFQAKPIITWIILILLTGIIVFISFTYDSAVRRFMKKALNDSDLIVLPHGLLGYKSHQDTKH